MIFMLILTLFNVYKFSINIAEYEEETKKDHEKTVLMIQHLEEQNDLKSLFEGARYFFVDIALCDLDNPILGEYYKIDMKYFYLICCRMQSALEKVFLHYKKNNPNDKFYTKYKTSIQLYLDNFRFTDIPKKSNTLYYTVLALIFFGGFFISIIISYFIKNK
ncbi:hypothetical protein TUBRATIS_23290 [Tubulinosema ratisbonensis]|uniref:Uncharacterized protein n=1 Tax=Tubulinosema ratisbonensis TaxID=291195 RepID=A0A437AJM3_9MICR|nr:hypothetical protein TUBRATIS_23290 [Tubulinosema ratisbonensis]